MITEFEKERLMKLANDLETGKIQTDLAVWKPEAEEEIVEVETFSWHYLVPAFLRWLTIAVIMLLFGIVIFH